MLSRFHQFSSSIASIYKSILKIEAMEMERYGLKGSHVQCLLAMEQAGEAVTGAQLSVLCEKDKAAVSRSLAELEQKDLVTRQSGYRAAVSLTEAGWQVARALEKTAQTAVEMAGGDLTEENRAMLYHALEQIAVRLREMSVEGVSRTNQKE